MSSALCVNGKMPSGLRMFVWGIREHVASTATRTGVCQCLDCVAVGTAFAPCPDSNCCVFCDKPAEGCECTKCAWGPRGLVTKQRLCSVCRAVNPTVVCGSCKVTMYCSAACQAKHSELHTPMCDTVRTAIYPYTGSDEYAWPYRLTSDVYFYPSPSPDLPPVTRLLDQCHADGCVSGAVMDHVCAMCLRACYCSAACMDADAHHPCAKHRPETGWGCNLYPGSVLPRALLADLKEKYSREEYPPDWFPGTLFTPEPGRVPPCLQIRNVVMAVWLACDGGAEKSDPRMRQFTYWTIRNRRALKHAVNRASSNDTSLLKMVCLIIGVTIRRGALCSGALRTEADVALREFFLVVRALGLEGVARVIAPHLFEGVGLGLGIEDVDSNEVLKTSLFIQLHQVGTKTDPTCTDD